MNYDWTIRLLDRLAHHGVRDVVVCPGSRSTPLALAAEHHPDIRTSVQIDERAAGFFALGLAKAARRPAVIITTSGTAVANLLPACIEAHQSNTPILLLTADRPAELRNTGANQTMHQPGLFDAYTRYAVDAPHPGEGDADAVVDAAMTAMRAWPPGPAHINQPIREPLSPTADDTARLQALGQRAPRPSAPAVFTKAAGEVPPIPPAMLAARGLIVCGPGDDLGPDVGRLAASLGAVVVADALSSQRFADATVLAGYDAYVDHPAVVGLAPAWILQLGTSPTSKSLRTYVAQQTTPRWKVDASGRGWNDIPGDTRIITCDARDLLAAWAKAAEAQAVAGDPSWTATWRALEAAARTEVQAMFASAPDVEAAWVPTALAASDRFFIGNSMPVRDLDRFGHATKPIEVFANRGVSGIDGTIATAAGMAQTGPLLAVIGDVAFQHDIGSLALMPEDMRLVVIDNGGGRIFHHLPVSKATEHFERLFLTKPQVDIEVACAAFGRSCETTTPADLDEALAGDAQVIVVVTDGQQSAEARQASRARLHAAIPGVLAQHS